MAKTKGANSFIYIKVSEICRFLQPNAVLKASRKQLESLGLIGKITPIDPKTVETVKLEKKPDSGGITVKVTQFDEPIAEVKTDEKVVAAEEI